MKINKIKSRHPLYPIWNGMKQRCYNPNRNSWKYYGERKIVVCQEWLNDFWKFVEDMGERPEGFSLERIDVNGNYEPSNCIWIPKQNQGKNRRNVIIDDLTFLPISRERKRQIRKNRLGICRKSCNSPIWKAGLCKEHYYENRLKDYPSSLF